MATLTVNTTPEFTEKLATYPPAAQAKLASLRALILETAEEVAGVNSIEECLKWGEPSYLVKKGSTIRMDWKERAPDQYAMYFKCTSKLVPTFRTLFEDQFTFENNRAILFGMEEEIPRAALKKCITMALRYHHLKHLPLLGQA